VDHVEVESNSQTGLRDRWEALKGWESTKASIASPIRGPKSYVHLHW
jgi:hypothetical protein